jgi:hypothetical protein
MKNEKNAKIEFCSLLDCSPEREKVRGNENGKCIVGKCGGVLCLQLKGTVFVLPGNIIW